MPKYIKVCSEPRRGTCEWADLNELLSQTAGNNATTMSFEEANIFLGSLYIAIGVAFAFRLMGMAIVNHYK